MRKTDFHNFKEINYFHQNIIRELSDKIKRKKDLNILEIGVGNGKLNSFIYQTFKPKENICMDYSKDCLKCLKFANKKIICDLDKTFDFDVKEIKDNSLDIVIILDVLEHLRWPEHTLKLLHRKLKKKGLVVASTPNINWYNYRLSFLIGNDVEHFHNTNHVRYWNLRSFRKLFSKNFMILRQLTDFKICKPFSYFLGKERFLSVKLKYNSKVFGDNQVIICKKNKDVWN